MGETHFKINYVGNNNYVVIMPSEEGDVQVASPRSLEQCCEWIISLEVDGA